MGKKALILGGGAPNLTLMSGALLALHREGIKFDVYSMAGAGAVVGLVYLAPKYLSCEQALIDTMNFGVSDAIYSICPINYKIFSKGGRLAAEFRKRWQSQPAVHAALFQYGMSDAQKLYSDWLLLAGAMMCPTDVNYFSSGICAHAPFIENIVDFDKVKHVSPAIHLNAYCIETEKPEEFYKHQINLHHFRAALSFPFIYPPYRIKDKHYYEGASFESLNLLSLMDRPEAEAIDKFVLFDVLEVNLIQRPRNLWDAYAQSVIVPLVANAQKELRIFYHWIKTGHEMERMPKPWKELHQRVKHKKKPKLYFVEFDVPEQARPYLLDWSRSNLERLFKIGYDAGKKLIRDHGADLVN